MSALAAAELDLTLHRADALLQAQQHVLEGIVRGQPLSEVLEALCRIVEAEADRPVRAAILLLDERGERLYTGAAPSLPPEYNAAVDGLPVDRGLGTCSAAAARCETIITPDIENDPSWASLRHLPLGLGLRGCWTVPIIASSGAVLGTFGTYFMEVRGPNQHERRLVEVLARTAALAIERRRADEALEASARRDRFLAELAASTQQLTDPAEVMATTARLLAEHLDVDRCAYAQVEDARVFVITGDYSRSVPSIVGRWPVAAFGPGCVRRMLVGEPYVVEDSTQHPEIGPEHLPAYEASNIRAVICVPLHKDGQFTAAMAVHVGRPRRWTRHDIALVQLVVARCWEALERTRVTRTLRESEARYRAMVEASPECVKLVAADGRLLQMNAAGLRMIGASDEAQAIGRCVYDVIAPEHREAFRAFNERVCRGIGGSLAFEVQGLHGVRRSMETTAVPLPAPDGGFLQLAVTRDVTARVNAERALARNRARLDYAVRLSGVGFWYCDLPFDELTWDERVKEHFFLAPDARVPLELFYERLHPDDREPTRTAIQASIDGRASYDIVYRTVHPQTGQIRWVRALGGAAYDEHGRPVSFDGVTVDVTTQKLEQERLARLLAREQESGRVLKKAAQAALTIHAAQSLEQVLQVITREARHIIGAHRADTIVDSPGGKGERLRASSLAQVRDASAKGSTAAEGKLGELVRKANRPVRLSAASGATLASSGGDAAPAGGWLGVPLVARDGGNLGLVLLSNKYEGEFSESDEAILVQLAQVAAIAIENTRLYEQLREQDRRKDEFLATLAHELRNPLAPIRTGLQVLERSSSVEQTAKTRQMMERQLVHLVRMVDDLLDISRVTLGKLTLKKERIDFRTVLHSALETTRPLIESRGHEFAVRLPKAPLPLHADPTRLAQVVANLLNNAAKYTSPGGRISLTAQIASGALVVQVSDTGVGIPADMVQRVFDMFTQVGRSTESGQTGLGIGLTLVRRLLQMHGGAIEAHSEGLGKGSTFTVTLPLAVGTHEHPAGMGESGGTASSGLRILVVDDNVDAAESLAMLLDLSGHTVAIAHSGRDALQRAGEFEPQLMFLDIGLPGMDGYEVAVRLREAAGEAAPILVALTGWGAEEDRRRAQQAGFAHHLVKPVDMDELAQVLGAAAS